MGPVTETVLARMRLLWEAADAAFRVDPAYAIEMANDGRLSAPQVVAQEKVGV